MKKLSVILIAALTLVSTSCGSLGGLGSGSNSSSSSNSSTGGSVLGNILGGLTGSNTTDGLLGLVIGSVKLSKKDLVGDWKYSEPGCAFTSQNLLAKAGGAVAAETVKNKLKSYYSTAGINSSNTHLSFAEDNNFSGAIKGIPLSGTYTFDPNTSAVKMKTGLGLVSMTGYVTRATNGISLNFELKKLLKVLQSLTKLSGNSTISAIGDLSTNYDGVRVGFDLKK